MRVYWIDGKRIKYQITFNLVTALMLAKAVKSCGVRDVWIEKILAHK